MSRVFLDENLLSWETFASSGQFGLPEHPKIVFQCLSEPLRRARYVHYERDNAAAQEAVQRMDEEELRELLREARELE